MLRIVSVFWLLHLGVAARAGTFDEVQEIFNNSCALSGCHATARPPILREGLSFNAIVGVSSSQGTVYVDPGNPDGSYLVAKIEGTGVGARMPFASPPLGDEKIQLIRDWISDGALESSGYTGRAYLMTTSASANETELHIINSYSGAQSFTGTLYNADGEQLGGTDVPLHTGTVPAQARVIVSSADLESIFEVNAWQGPAVLEVTSTDGFDLMSKLRSPSGLVSNTNCVRTRDAHNVEGFDSENRTFIRLINISDSAIQNITGTLRDEDGNVVGEEGAVLLASLGAKQQVFLNRDDIAALVGSSWNGTASLSLVNPDESIRLLNLNFVNSETFFNFSCFESASTSARVYLMTNSQSANVSETHIINTADVAQPVSATLYGGSGALLGTSDVSLADAMIPAGGRIKISASELEARTGADAWSGPALLELNGASDIELMTRLQSPSGLISNTNCVRTDNVQNIEGADSNNRTFIRFINQGNQSITNIRGSMYDADGDLIGQGNELFVNELAPKQALFMNREQLAQVVGTSWNGEASLVISESDEDLRLLNLNFVNNETFFNFSCYEGGRAEAASGTDGGTTPGFPVIPGGPIY